MDHSDNKLADRSQSTTDLRPKDLRHLEEYFKEKGDSEFVYDEIPDIFCFHGEGGCTFCEEFADWERLRERGYLDF
jgi:hypothetical protein